jgi:two-component system, chemotaxis family, chemotaxis protein CheY
LNVNGWQLLPVGQSPMKRILIVDDSPTMRRMVQASLRDLKDIRCDEAGSGLEAIEQLALAQVDLIILDLNMPDMHGLDVLRFVRGHAAYRTVPIIVLTTRGDEPSRVAALAAGASFYLTKPFAPQLLAAHAQELLQVH